VGQKVFREDCTRLPKFPLAFVELASGRFPHCYRFWCQNGAIMILLLPFGLNNQSKIFPEKQNL